jgi:glyoxalase family protein
MLTQIEGIHHITAMAGDAVANNRFFTGLLGLRRVKKTVNFDAPDVYHLYYADGAGTPGSVMTYFPFPNIGKGSRGTGEVETTLFSVPTGSLGWWKERLAAASVGNIEARTEFGENRLFFDGPDGERLALVEVAGDPRRPWTGNGIGDAEAIRGFHSARMRLQDIGATQELLNAMGYYAESSDGEIVRLVLPQGNGASHIELQADPSGPRARQGAGSVHHIAFAVKDRQAQLAARKALSEIGMQITPVIDRDYFWAIYFRTPGGVLFEIATDEPGFARDEPAEHLGEGLMLPTQHAHLRAYLENSLPPL